jgi:hypothetical protein
MDGLMDQLAGEAGLHGYVSIRNVGIGALQNLSFNLTTNSRGNSGASQSAAGTQHVFQFA